MSFLRRWFSRRRVPIWYDPSYRLPLPGLPARTGIEPRRADYVAWYLLDCGAARSADLRPPHRIGYDDAARVHTPEFLDSLQRPETLARIFGVDPWDVPVDELLHNTRLACGGTLAAAREALARGGPTLNLLGGFHHAAPDRGGGLCVLNDVAIAIAALRAEGFCDLVAVLDLDAHPPDGTAECLRGDDHTWLGSLSGSDWGAIEGVDETLLSPGCGDGPYLEALDALLGRMPRPRLAFVIAGGDVLAGDRFGLLGLTLEGARERDLRVAAALDGLASVWLPGGGYHPDAWKLLAGTGLALAKRTRAPVPEDLDPLRVWYGRIATTLAPERLAGEDLSFVDLEPALGIPGHGARRLLGFYTAEGIEYGLARYGLLDHLRRLGYDRFRVEVEKGGVGDRARLFGHAAGAEHLLIELVVERRRIADHDVLFVHWLALRNPRATFSPLRPRLPGQEVPGLGIAREMGELLARMAERLGLAGVAFRPAWYHTAYAARYRFRFVDPARQARFEAMVRDLGHLPLLEVTEAVAAKRVLCDGAPYAWEADDMVFWLEGHSPSEEATPAPEPGRFTLRPADATVEAPSDTR